MADSSDGPAAGAAASASVPKPVLKAVPTPVPTPVPRLTLDDVAHLTSASDYTAFTAPGVDARVRNEALRKLFHTDPHFQQSDGLDVAVDEEVRLAQSPLARQRVILLARAMGMLDDELQDQPPAAAEPPAL